MQNFPAYTVPLNGNGIDSTFACEKDKINNNKKKSQINKWKKKQNCILDKTCWNWLDVDHICRHFIFIDIPSKTKIPVSYQ